MTAGEPHADAGRPAPREETGAGGRFAHGAARGSRPRELSTAVLALAAATGFAGASAAVATYAASGTVGPAPSLVELRVRDGLAEDRAVGVVVAPGRVLTVAHALGDPPATPIRWSPAPSGARGGTARVVAVDRAADLALLAVRGVDGPRVTLAPSPAATAREPAPRWGTAPGAGSLPGGRRVRTVALRARFTDTAGTTVRRPVLRLDTAVAPGDSGSPVLDGRGRLAGIVFATARTGAGTSWATAAPALHRLLTRRVR